ncbi:choice-of-anchor Q domain-containing protein [Vibrio maritimus]
MNPIKHCSLILITLLFGCGGSDSDTSAKASIKPVTRPTFDDIMERYNSDTSPYSFSTETIGLVLQANYQGLTYLSSQLNSTQNTLPSSIMCDSGQLEKSTTKDDELGIEQTTYAYDNCRLGPVTYNGQKTVVTRSWFNNDTATPKNFSLIFQDFSVTNTRTPDESYSLHGSINHTNALQCDHLVEVNIGRFTTGEVPSKVMNYRAQSDSCHNQLPSYNVDGAIYIANLGKVTLKSAEDISIGINDGIEGLLALQGEKHTTYIRQSTLSGQKVNHVSLDINNDGNDDKEWYLPFSYLSATEKLDLSDADGDGIWASWEIKHGLNPAINDSEEDSDNDGFSNYLEFLLNTNPNQYNTDLPVDMQFGQRSDHYYFDQAYQYSDKKIDLIFSTNVPKAAARLLGNVDITIASPWIEASYSLIPSCQIEDMGTPPISIEYIVCNDVDISSIAEEPVSIGTINVTLIDRNNIDLMATISSKQLGTIQRDFPAINVKPIDFDTWLTTPPSLGAVGSKTQQTLHISQSAQTWYEGDYNQQSPEKVKLTGQLPAGTSAEITGFINAADFDCSHTSNSFECRLPLESRTLEVTVNLNDIAQRVVVPIQSEIELTDNRSIAHQESNLLIVRGLATLELNQAINATEDVHYQLPAGDYVGSLTFDTPRVLDGVKGTHLWLDSDENKNLSDSLASSAELTLKNMNIHLIGHAHLSLATGNLQHTHLQSWKNTGPLLTSSQDLKLTGNYIRLIHPTMNNYPFKFQANLNASNNLVTSDDPSLRRPIQLPFNLTSQIHYYTNNTFDGVCYRSQTNTHYLNNLFLGLDSAYNCPVNSYHDLFQHNLFSFTDSKATWPSSNLFTKAPVVIADGRYQLIIDSPAIDAGGDVNGIEESDRLKAPRISGAQIDIGAHEYQH